MSKEIKTKALFLYAGLGGYAYPFYNSGEYDITFVENDANIIPHLQAKYPNAKVVEADAIEYVEEYKESFGFIFASPPCVANSKLNNLRAKGTAKGQRPRLPSLLSIELKIFFDKFFMGDYIIENTIPYYSFPIPYSVVGRHLVLSSFSILCNKDLKKNTVLLNSWGKWNTKSEKAVIVRHRKLGETLTMRQSFNIRAANRPELAGIDFEKIKGDVKQYYNNTMELDVSQYLFDCYETHKSKDSIKIDKNPTDVSQ